MITDLIVDSIWRNTLSGELYTVIGVSTAGCGDSVAWRHSSGQEGGGSAIQFFNSHTLVEKSHKTYPTLPTRD